jgi:hypothetical protein
VSQESQELQATGVRRAVLAGRDSTVGQRPGSASGAGGQALPELADVRCQRIIARARASSVPQRSLGDLLKAQVPRKRIGLR